MSWSSLFMLIAVLIGLIKSLRHVALRLHEFQQARRQKNDSQHWIQGGQTSRSNLLEEMDEEWRLNSSKAEESKDKDDVKAGRVFNPYKPAQQVT